MGNRNEELDGTAQMCTEGAHQARAQIALETRRPLCAVSLSSSPSKRGGGATAWKSIADFLTPTDVRPLSDHPFRLVIPRCSIT